MTCRILLCTDGSTFSKAAAAMAIQIAAAHEDAVLVALHVVNVVVPSGNLLKDIPGRLGFEPAVVSPEVESAHTRKGEDVLAEVARDAEIAGVLAQTLIDQGVVRERIAHHARHADLVIMGMRGLTEDSHPGQGGGNLDQAIDDLLVPVLFVSRGHEKITGIALGYDGSDGAAQAIKAAEIIAEPTKVPVHAIYVSADGTGGEILDECEQIYPDLHVNRMVVRADEPHTAVAEAAVTQGANVLALGFRGRSKVKDFLFGTAAHFIIANTNLMVLVAH